MIEDARREEQTAAGGLLGFSAGFLVSSAVRQPRLRYLPVEREWTWATDIGDRVAMDWFWRFGCAIVLGVVAALLARALGGLGRATVHRLVLVGLVTSVWSIAFTTMQLLR